MHLEDLREYLHRGGAATLNHPATHEVAQGAVVAPVRFRQENQVPKGPKWEQK